MGGRGRRKHILELRARHRALALRLRLQQRAYGLEPAMARPAARRARPPPRQDGSARRGSGRPLLHDLWTARDAYISVVLDRSPENVTRFLAAHASRELSPGERVTVLELLELERHTQLMYTSCGWFFDEISGIETVQVIAYAGRVLQLAAKLFGDAGKTLESKFLEILQRAPSNVPEFANGAAVYA